MSTVTATVTATEPTLPRGVDGSGYRAAVMEALWNTARFAKALWVRRAQDLNIRHSGAYLRGIQEATIRQVKGGETPTGLDVTLAVVNTAPHARIVEHGHGPFSLARAIDWSKGGGAIKHGKNGPYLRIPFRHAAYQSPKQRERSGMTPAALRAMMPQQIYSQARALQPGQRLQHRTQAGIVSGPGGAFEARRGARMIAGRDRNGLQLSNPGWQTSKFHGMQKTGARGHTRYITIRTITPSSPGWNIPAQRGHRVAEQVTRVINGGVGHDRFRRFLVEAVRRHGGMP